MSKWDDTRDVRFDAHVRVDGDCHIWTGTKTIAGYGQLRIRRSARLNAHRYSFDRANPATPAGTSEVVMHSCDTPACVNPAHLTAASQKANMADAASKGRMRPWCASKQECKRGHPLSGPNLRLNGNGSRQCKACHALRQRVRKARITSLPATAVLSPTSQK